MERPPAAAAATVGDATVPGVSYASSTCFLHRIPHLTPHMPCPHHPTLTPAALNPASLNPATLAPGHLRPATLTPPP